MVQTRAEKAGKGKGIAERRSSSANRNGGDGDDKSGNRKRKHTNRLDSITDNNAPKMTIELASVDASGYGYFNDNKINEMGEKQQWSNEHLKCLLDTCIEEINVVGKKGLSLHKDSLNKLGRVLKEKFDMDFTRKQMKNAYDNLKHKYIGWVYLKNKTGNIYSAQTNTFTLSNEEWEEFKKGHPKAASLKTVPLPFPELCAQLFDGNTGNCKRTSTQTSGVGSPSCQHVQQLLLTGTVFQDTEDDAGTSHQTSEPTLEPNPNMRAKTSSINVDDLAVVMQKALQYLIKGKEGPTVLECSEKLKLVGLEPLDPIFLAAFYIFGVSLDMREAWMTLPDIPDVLRGWIAMTAKSLGLIK